MAQFASLCTYLVNSPGNVTEVISKANPGNLKRSRNYTSLSFLFTPRVPSREKRLPTTTRAFILRSSLPSCRTSIKSGRKTCIFLAWVKKRISILGKGPCLERCPGSHQAPPWQGARLEQSPHLLTRSQGQVTTLPTAPASDFL